MPDLADSDRTDGANSWTSRATPAGVREIARRLSPSLKSYLKPLQETLNGPKLAPAEILPLPKQEVRQLIINELLVDAADESAPEVFGFLMGGLTLFYVGSPFDPVRKVRDGSFASKVVGVPAVLLLVTGIWLGIRDPA